MNGLLSQLVKLVSPPVPSIRIGSRCELITGMKLELPKEYLDFASLFGPGKFRRRSGSPFLWVDDLIGCQIDDGYLKDLYSANHPAWEKDLPRAYPNSTALLRFLPWGGNDGGVTYGWVVDGAPDEWKAAYAVDDEIYPQGISMLELILRLFTSGRLEDEQPIGYCSIPEFWPVGYERWK